MTETILATEAAETTETTTEFNFRDHLSDDYKEKFPEFKDLNSMAKGYDNLVSKMGKDPIVKPKEDAPQEEKDAYIKNLQKELGAPDSVEAYDFKVSDDAPEGFLNDELTGKMKDVMLKHALSPEVAADLFNTYSEFQLEALNAQDVNVNEAFESGVTQLKQDWGKDFEGNVNKTKAFADKHFSEATVKKYGNDPEFIKDVFNLQSKTAEGRIENTAETVRQTPDDLRTEARALSAKPEWSNAMLPGHQTVVARVKELYAKAADMEAS